MREQLIQSAGLGILNHRDSPCRFWRNNVGFDHEKKVHYGLAKGSSDVVGLVRVVITPAMVGKTVALFACVEFKTPSGRRTPEQEAWDRAIKRLGGVSELHRSEADAMEFVRKANEGLIALEGI